MDKQTQNNKNRIWTICSNSSAGEDIPLDLKLKSAVQIIAVRIWNGKDSSYCKAKCFSHSIDYANVFKHTAAVFLQPCGEEAVFESVDAGLHGVLGGWGHSGHLWPVGGDTLSRSPPGVGLGSWQSTRQPRWPAVAASTVAVNWRVNWEHVPPSWICRCLEW